MASEIIVQTIKGPTSGANANKIIVPSGQTLDASAGFTPPTGHLVQIESNTHSSFDSTANGWVDAVTQTITPKYDNSLIVVRYTGHLYKYNSDVYPNSEARITQDQGGSLTQLVKHPYVTYHEGDSYMYSLSMSARFTVTNASEYTIRVQVDPKTYHTYIYGDSNLLTVEEIKQ